MLPVINGQLTAEGANSLLAYKFPEMYNPGMQDSDIYTNTPISILNKNRDDRFINESQGATTSIVASLVRHNLMTDMGIGRSINPTAAHMPFGYRASTSILGGVNRSISSITTPGGGLSQKAQNAISSLPNKTKSILNTNQVKSNKSLSLGGLSHYILPQGGLIGTAKSFGFWNFVAGDPRDLMENNVIENMATVGMHYGIGEAVKQGKSYLGTMGNTKLKAIISSDDVLLKKLGFNSPDDFMSTLKGLDIPDQRRITGKILSSELTHLHGTATSIGEKLGARTNTTDMGKSKSILNSIKNQSKKLLTMAYGGMQTGDALLANSSARSNMLNQLGVVGGKALKLTNIASGVFAAGQVIDAAVGYVKDYEKQFLSQVSNYETAYAPLELGGVTGTEQQRAIEAMQQSQLNVRGMLGNEAGMFH